MGFLREVWRRAVSGDVLTDDERAAATAEGLEVLAEGLPCTRRLRDFRAPGRRSVRRVTRTSGGVLLTRSRLVVWGAGERHVDVARTALPLAGLTATEPRPGVLLVSYDAARLFPDRSGRVELELRTPEAARVVAAVTGG
ncbi:hypothetical protein [Nocardioides sp. SYSU D00038]|uniref:hypothetical protein n=1 Tax=Nocardioides sp. SYSU D00038 TaxID=2812554 RepID=UPI001966F3ED|nr:hypothetical protein [Nocardioides sp. SYSU D00038]